MITDIINFIKLRFNKSKKLLKEPVQCRWGMDYSTRFTEEFKALVNAADEKITPFVTKEKPYYTVYFLDEDENDQSREYDTCDNESCIQQSKEALAKEGIKAEPRYMQNDGDHGRIELCTQCGTPLVEWLTWSNDELDYIEELKPWTPEVLKENAFEIHVILQSQPTLDNCISDYAKHQGGEILQEAIKRREEYFQRIHALATAVIKAKL